VTDLLSGNNTPTGGEWMALKSVWLQNCQFQHPYINLIAEYNLISLVSKAICTIRTILIAFHGAVTTHNYISITLLAAAVWPLAFSAENNRQTELQTAVRLCA